MNNSVKISAVLVVLLAFAFMIFAPSFGLDLHMSPTFQGLAIGIAVALMFTMGILHFWKKPKVRVLTARAHR